MIQPFSFTFFHVFAFATQLFYTPVTTSNLRDQAPLFTELRLLEGTLNFFIQLQHHSQLLCFLFVVNQMNWLKISTKNLSQKYTKYMPSFSYMANQKFNAKHFENLVYTYIPQIYHLATLSRTFASRDDRIVDFHYPILSCFWKMISVSDPNPVLVEIILSISENYPKVYCDAKYTFLCCVYFASWDKLTVEAILLLAKHDWLK